MGPSRPSCRPSPKSRADPERIWQDSPDEWGFARTDRYYRELKQLISTLARSPRRAPACNHVKHGCRFSKSGRHVVYFMETIYGIEVLRVLHDRMLPTKHL